jgi:Domain of unknown function (DUF6379)
MYENQMILTRGFHNVYREGHVIGFQIQVKTAYYRGTFLDIIGTFDIAVDGVKFSRDRRRPLPGRRFRVLGGFCATVSSGFPIRNRCGTAKTKLFSAA